MNEFEKYLKDNRARLDVEEPETDIIWQGIQQRSQDNKLQKMARIRRMRFLSVAASIALLIGLSFLFYPKENTIHPKEEFSMADISPELGEQEKAFRLQVSQKMKILGIDTLNRAEYEEIFLELDLLDQINQEFREDIPQHGYNDQLINTLTKYYERKIRILERLAREIEKKEHHDQINKEKHM